MFLLDLCPSEIMVRGISQIPIMYSNFATWHVKLYDVTHGWSNYDCMDLLGCASPCIYIHIIYIYIHMIYIYIRMIYIYTYIIYINIYVCRTDSSQWVYSGISHNCSTYWFLERKPWICCFLWKFQPKNLGVTRGDSPTKTKQLCQPMKNILH